MTQYGNTSGKGEIKVTLANIRLENGTIAGASTKSYSVPNLEALEKDLASQVSDHSQSKGTYLIKGKDNSAVTADTFEESNKIVIDQLKRAIGTGAHDMTYGALCGYILVDGIEMGDGCVYIPWWEL
jgi:hypothetical protein